MAAKPSSTTPTKRKKKQLPLDSKRQKISKSKAKDKKNKNKKNSRENSSKLREKKNINETTGAAENDGVQLETSSLELSFFVHQYQSANGVQLSSLELESFKDTCILDLCERPAHNISNLGQHIKVAFGPSWKEVLCGKHLQEGKVDPGNPAVLVISLSALRSLELLRELRSLTKECHPAKLFSKHMKIEEQVSLLKNRVNIACGTPNRIKKLIDMEALGLSRLAVIVLDNAHRC
ncbi:protein CMSS1 [Forsythia ovata]|uniref:Protein CMSS1 n=1 Tax=Forsythia ovata TaxID=205694 RepID=A0ABD1UYS4_9LAMI